MFSFLRKRVFKIDNLQNNKTEEFYGFRLNNLQSCFLNNWDGKNAVVEATTGAGKTLCLFIAAQRYLEKGQRVVYIAPTRAILRQKYDDEALPIFGRDIVGMKTGDTTEVDDEIAFTFTTPESFTIALRNRFNWADAGLVLIDEAHFIYGIYGNRSKILDGILGYLLHHEIPTVLASATIPEAENLARQIGGQLFRYTSSDIKIIDRKVVTSDKRKALEELIKRHKEDQVLIFVPTIDTGLRIASELGAPFHYSGLNREQRKQVETDFCSGKTKLVVATTTLAYGVNTPADVVIVYGTRRGGSYYHPFELTQMRGRAGRFKKEGYFYVIGDVHEVADRPVNLIKPAAGLDEAVITELCIQGSLKMAELPSQSILGNKAHLRKAIKEFTGSSLITVNKNTLSLTPEGRIIARYLLSFNRYSKAKNIAEKVSSAGKFDKYELASIIWAELLDLKMAIPTRDIAQKVSKNALRFQVIEAHCGCQIKTNEAALIWTICTGNYNSETVKRMRIYDVERWLTALSKIKELTGKEFIVYQEIVEIGTILTSITKDPSSAVFITEHKNTLDDTDFDEEIKEVMKYVSQEVF